MIGNLIHMAEQYISSPSGSTELINAEADTEDIINLVLDMDCISADDTVDFAQAFSPDYNGLSELWHFVKDNLEYIEDKEGLEVVKGPAYLWEHRTCSIAPDKKYCGGDCKSFSLFIGSILQNMGIPYIYRFVAYDNGAWVSHVYPVAYLNGREVIMDAVHDRYDEELNYSWKDDRPSCSTGIGKIGQVAQSGNAVKALIAAAVAFVLYEILIKD